MKKFIYNLFLFAGAVAIILVLSIVFYCFIFKTPQTSRIPFLGDSTGKASINTKKQPNTKTTHREERPIFSPISS